MTYGGSTYGGSTFGGTADNTHYLQAPLTTIRADTQTPDVTLGTPNTIGAPTASLTVSAETGRPVTTSPEHVSASGWSVAIVNPDTNRLVTPTVLDAPAINPGPNTQPELRVPVPRDESWLSDAYDSDPEMRVWKDGDRQPVEVLRDVELQTDRTILVGVGGVELERRAQREYNDDRRHLAVRNLIQSETSYAVFALDVGRLRR